MAVAIAVGAIDEETKDMKPIQLTSEEKITAEALSLRVRTAEQELALLEQRHAVLLQQLPFLRQERDGYATKVLEAHKAPKGSTVNWTDGVIIPPTPEAKPPKTEPASAKKDESKTK
jgi:hypothetical protein